MKARDVAQAHLADLQTQGKYGVQYLRYWVDEEAGKVFCLVDAPTEEAAQLVHREAGRATGTPDQPPAAPGAPPGARSGA